MGGLGECVWGVTCGGCGSGLDEEIDVLGRE